MSAYVIVDIEVVDDEPYQEYVRQAPAFVEKHGGVYRVRGGNASAVEGSWQPPRLVVIEFPSRDAANALLNDPDYLEIAPLRRDNTRSKLIVVDGFDD